MKKLVPFIVLWALMSVSPLSAQTDGANDEIQELQERVEILTEEVQNMKAGSMGSGLSDRLSIGGYGEIVYNNTRSENEKGESAGGSATADTLRHVVYVGYKFNENWKLFTELEMEHADSSYTELAYLDYTPSKAFGVRTGLILTPVGFLNPVHETPTFYSVNRPSLEKNIIPSTWRAIGTGILGEFSGFEYELYALNSLDASGMSAENTRGARQKGIKADARRFAFTGRLDYHIFPYWEVGVGFYTGKMNKTLTDVKQTLWEAHTEFKWQGLRVRALHVNLRNNDVAALNDELGYTGQNGIGESSSGQYVEAGYNVLERTSYTYQVIPFVRYSQYNMHEDVASGFEADKSLDKTDITLGVSTKPTENLALKADYVISKNEAETGQDSWNLGIGWQF